jgi:hypothetical protein
MRERCFARWNMVRQKHANALVTFSQPLGRWARMVLTHAS